MNGLAYFKPTGLVRSSTAVAPGFSGGGATLYPTIANSLLLVDFANSCTDTAGVTLAGDGDAVWTVRLPSGWGASLGDGLLRQDTLANRPTWRTTGLQCNGTSSRLIFPATISLDGAFTVYNVLDMQGSYKTLFFGFTGNVGAWGGVVHDYNVSGLRAYDQSVTYLQTATHSPTGKILTRVRRDASNNMYFAATGLAETPESTTSYTWVLDRWLARGGGTPDWTNSGIRSLGGMIIGADAVAAGTSAAAEAWLSARFGVAL